MSSNSSSLFRRFFKKSKQTFSSFSKALSKLLIVNKSNWKWMNLGALFFLLLVGFGNMIFYAGSLTFGWILYISIMMVAFPLGIGGATKLGLVILKKVPKETGWIIYGAIPTFFIYFNTPFKGTLVLIFYMLLTFVFIFGALSNLFSSSWPSLGRVRKLLNVFFLTLGFVNLSLLVFFLSFDGRPLEKEIEAFELKYKAPQLNLPDPSLAGETAFSAYTYGNGDDKHRPEFGEEADIFSNTVDGSAFLDEWKKMGGKLRSAYWGFGSDSLPLNGRIWVPDLNTPAPVVLMVHGNHLDRDYSDEGYAYLCEHLASHGYIAATVDENFLNGSPTNIFSGLWGENDARGWLMLKHLEFLKIQSEDSTSLLFEKADLDKVVLIGHSRGGEAVCIAACFNELSYFPDNAEEAFDFGFGIKGLVSIAQVDGQYSPSNTATPLKDLNFLLMHGSLDADLTSYSGFKQYNRLKFTDSLNHFKAGVYIEGANHGQFNTSWGDNDIGYPYGVLINRERMLKKADQEQIALVMITSFLKATFNDEPLYTEIFKDSRVAREWLPTTRYFNQYMSDEEIILANFEDDLDINSVECGATVRFEKLAKLKEKKNTLRWGSSGTKSLILGWNNESDSVPGIYELKFSEALDMVANEAEYLILDVGVLTDMPEKRMGEKEDEENDGENEAGNKENAEKESRKERKKRKKMEANNEGLEDSDTEDEAILEDEEGKEDENIVNRTGFTIQLGDDAGNVSGIAVQDYYTLAPVINMQLFKLKVFEKNSDPELIPQHIRIPLSSFVSENDSLDLSSIVTLSLIFDDGDKGSVSVDNIGYTTNN